MCIVYNTEQVCFHLNSVLDIHVISVVDCSLSNRYCVASLRDDLSSHSLSGWHKFFLRYNLVYKADTVSFVCINVIACEDHFLRTSHTYKTGKLLCSTESRDNSETTLRLSEDCVLACDTDITAHRDLASAAKCKTVDSSDCNLTHIL